jgi:hypothetical protein
MARFFDVQIISGTAPGPYTIYYDTISVSNIVTLTNSGNPATNISFSSLSLGVNVTIPDNTTSIILFNEQCSIDETFIVPTSTPTPTPTNTPTPTPTATNTPTPTPTSTSTPTPTPTPNCEFDVDLSVNYSPTDISLTNNSINENNSINTTIGTLSTVTLDTNDTHTYSIVGGSSNFNISGDVLRSSVVFDYETTTSYIITIRTTDSLGQFYDKSFTIFINNVNEAPYGLSINNNSQQENTSIGTDIGTFSTLDEDAGDTFTYSLHDTSNFPDNNSFTLTSSGVLRNAVVFNFEVKTSYTIRVRTTDAGGLTYDGTFTINVTNQNEPPTNINLSSSSISENVPTGTTIGTLSATDPDAGDTFTFSLVDVGLYPDNNSFFIDGTTLKSSVIFDFETKSSYSIRVRVTDAGGLTFDKTITITITDVTIVVTASATTNVTCNGGNNGVITVSNTTGGTASYTYSRDGVNYQVGTTFSSLTAGSYTIYAKDSYGEIGTTNVTVTQPEAITFITTNTSPTCNGGTDGSIVVSGVSGGSGTYTYSKDGTNYQAGTTFSSLSSGSYVIYVKDSNNCIGTTSVTLSRTAVTATVTQTNLTCFNGGNGSISITNVSGGQGGPYSTKLNAGGTYQVLSTTRNYTSLSAGSYTVFVKDTTGCEVTYPITLTQPTQVTVTLISSTPPTCYNGGDGSISFSAGGGNGSYEFRLNGGTWQPSGIFTGLSVGTYTIQTRDTNGCESSTTNVTLSKSAPTASVSQTNVSCNGGSNGTITVTSPSGGSGSGYTYSRDGVNYQSSGTFSSLPIGSYDIYIKDGAGCVSYLTSIIITQPTSQSATITVNTFATCNGGADGVITLSSAGGTFPKTYRLYADTSAPYTTCGGDLIATYNSVTSGSPSVSVSNIDEFGYCLEVTDNNGCVINSGVVTTTSCIGTCYTITLPENTLTSNGEDLYIMYTKTDGTFVSQPYFNFPTEFSSNNDYIINLCSTSTPSFKYGVGGEGIIDLSFNITVNGSCDNSQWCGGADPFIPPPPTSTPIPEGGGGGDTYFCDYGQGCVEQIDPCPNNSIDCGLNNPTIE